MREVNPLLKAYAQENIFPQYSENDGGHSLGHIEYVIRRSILFSEQFENVDVDMVYAAAVFHDIAHHIDKKNHEKLSAEIFYGDGKMKEFFTESQRLTVKEAIEDHRASLDGAPRSVYGKIISSADRSTDVEEFLRRTHAYTLRHFPSCGEDEAVERAYRHTLEKYGTSGYAKQYVEDAEYENFKRKINSALGSKEQFKKLYLDVVRF